MLYPPEDVEINVVADLREILAEDLAELGYPVDPGADAMTLAITYINIDIRRVSARPRAIHEACSLRCPESLTLGYEGLKAKFAAGSGVSSHLSTGIRRVDYQDGLLNDWGIHHFHLGLAMRRDGFAERTSEILYALVQPEDVYCITIAPPSVSV